MLSLGQLEQAHVFVAAARLISKHTSLVCSMQRRRQLELGDICICGIVELLLKQLNGRVVDHADDADAHVALEHVLDAVAEEGHDGQKEPHREEERRRFSGRTNEC